MQETWVRSLGQENPLEKEMATHSSFLGWEISWTEEPDRLQSMGLQRVRHDWVTEHSTHTHTHHIHVNTHQLLLYSVLHSISTFLKPCLYPFSPLSCLSCSFSPTSVGHFLLIFNQETYSHGVINDLHLAKPLINCVLSLHHQELPW